MEMFSLNWFLMKASTVGPRVVILLLLMAIGGLTACTSSSQLPESTAPAADVDAPDADHDAEADAPSGTAGDPENGQALFVACAACHGMDARGVPGLGMDLHDNEFIANMSDDESVAFLKIGRPASHELNTTGVDMPPKGGNPALSDQDLLDIVAYMRSLE